ncbi:hypothetical protein GCM10027597_25050 [Saccharopolyspora tripterygii]
MRESSATIANLLVEASGPCARSAYDASPIRSQARATPVVSDDPLVGGLHHRQDPDRNTCSRALLNRVRTRPPTIA